jgi:hypothetical protein
MQTININGKKWVVELDWEILPGDNSLREELKEVALKTHTDYGIVVESDEQYSVGLSTKSSKDPSAALYLALANQYDRENLTADSYGALLDWVVIESVGNDKFWMSVIKKGLPSPQFDKIFDITTVKDKITELLINDSYRIFSTSPEIVSIFGEFKNIENIGLNELVKNVKTKIKLKKLTGLPLPVIYAGLGVIGAILVLYGVYYVFDSYNMKKHFIEMQNKQKETELRQKAEYEHKLLEYNKKVKETYDNAKTEIVKKITFPQSVVLLSWDSFINSLKVNNNGWNITSVTCIYSGVDGVCEVRFVKDHFATNKMLLELFPDVVFDHSGATLRVKLNFDLPVEAQQPQAIDSVVGSPKDWNNGFISKMQSFNFVDINYAVKSAKKINLILPMKPTGPGASPAPQNKPGVASKVDDGFNYYTGELIVHSNKFYMFEEFIRSTSYDGIAIKGANFKVSSDGDVAWELIFDYFWNSNDDTGIFQTQSQPVKKVENKPSSPVQNENNKK